MQDYHILESRYVGGYVVWLRFRDGTAGEIDLSTALRGPVFAPLRDPGVFRRFAIHPEFHTLVWPNGAHLAPESAAGQSLSSPDGKSKRTVTSVHLDIAR